MTPLTFDTKYGHLVSGSLPGACVCECSASGDCTEAVRAWRGYLDFAESLRPVESLARRYLREFGCWDDLDVADLEEVIADRILWLAACETRESGIWFGLVN